MPDTTNRPTLNDVAVRIDAEHQDHPQAYAAVDMLDYLTEHGYVITHPDDVPEAHNAYPWPDNPNQAKLGRFIGWGDCRRHIFGDAHA